MTSSGTPLKIGLIGVGTHAREVLIPGINQVPEDLRLVALATAHEATARAAGEFYRLPCHVGYEKLIADPNVEAVMIASSGDHETAALAALAYSLAPYHLVNIYVRGDSLQEFFAFVYRLKKKRSHS